MKHENYELNLLANVSKTLTENSDAVEIVTLLGRIFNKFGRLSNKFVELKTFNIFIYDENSKTLRDFSKSWVTIEQHASPYNEKLYLALTQLSQFDFFVNGIPYKMDELVNFQNIKTANDSNIVMFPLKKHTKPFGMLEMTFPGSIKNLLDPDFFMLMSIASYQISLKIQNAILAEQMQKNIDFHRSMKDIAKIIETQYELNYIIPMLGEMIDRFVSNHLVYVFLKREESGNFKLVWPNACRDTNILELITHTHMESKFQLVNDGKVGIFPLIGKKSVLGCIVAHSNTDTLSESEIDYLEQLTKQSSITLQRANTYAEVLQHATLDALTGLNNRRLFESRLKQEVSASQRQNKPLSAIMLDIDFFKKVNDTYGHAAGDVVLKHVSQLIKTGLRECDIPARYGGEEFAIILPFTKLEEAAIVAERLRKRVESTPINITNEEGETSTLNPTISVGVHEYEFTDTPAGLFEKADKALYEAKTSGRNKVCICPKEPSK